MSNLNEENRFNKMNKYIFKKHLIGALEVLVGKNIIQLEQYQFIVNIVREEGKKYNSTDDYLRLAIFNEKNINNKVFDVNQVVSLFSALEPLYPLWIEMMLNTQNDTVIELRTSIRFRKPTELKNKEAGYPPFKVIKK